MSDLKPYPAYKPAGVPWLQQVPEHWDMLPNRSLVRKRKVLVGKRHKEYQLLSLTKQGIIVRDLSTGKGKFSADMGTSQEVRIGDLVFCLFDVPETPRTVGLSRHEGMITGAYTVFETIGSGSAEYFDYFYRAMDDRKMLGPLYSGLRNTIPLDRLLVAKTPQPPPDEQHLIVRYLHALDTKVKRYIRTKRKLIAALQEQKQAIIQRAVTRGLDPKVKLKPSGVEWLGEVPEHWEEIPLKRIARFENTGSWGHDEGYVEVPVATTAQIDRDGNFKVEAMPRRFFSATEAARYTCTIGDILVVKSSGSMANVISGKCGIIRQGVEPFVFSNFLLRARAITQAIRPEYLFLLLRSHITRERIKRMVSGSTYPNLKVGEYTSAMFPLPPLEEQDGILDTLLKEVGVIEQAEAMVAKDIETMQEYHTRLIADVVTGAVDVRGAAQALPQQSIELTADEPMDEEPLSMAAEEEETYENE